MIDIKLSNNSCIFDSAQFDSAQEALDWVLGRGGIYVAQISSKNPVENLDFRNWSIDDNKETISEYDGSDWNILSRNEIITALEILNKAH